MKAIVVYNEDADRVFAKDKMELVAFHTLPRVGELIQFQETTWKVIEVLHYCASPGGLIQHPKIRVKMYPEWV